MRTARREKEQRGKEGSRVCGQAGEWEATRSEQGIQDKDEVGKGRGGVGGGGGGRWGRLEGGGSGRKAREQEGQAEGGASEVGWVSARGCFSHCRTHILFVCSCVRVSMCRLFAIWRRSHLRRRECWAGCQRHVNALSAEEWRRPRCPLPSEARQVPEEARRRCLPSRLGRSSSSLCAQRAVSGGDDAGREILWRGKRTSVSIGTGKQTSRGEPGVEACEAAWKSYPKEEEGSEREGREGANSRGVFQMGREGS